MQWHGALPFESLLAALTSRFSRMRADGLAGTADPRASATAFLAAVHSATILELVAHGHSGMRHRASIESLVEVLWGGIAPTLPGGRAKARRYGCEARGSGTIGRQRYWNASPGLRPSALALFVGRDAPGTNPKPKRGKQPDEPQGSQSRQREVAEARRHRDRKPCHLHYDRLASRLLVE